MLKIIGGEYRSRRLRAPDDAEVTRPYTGVAREAVFNLLRGWFEDATVLDLFAGIGTMGLEAVSRGAKQVVMIENNRKMFQLLEENIASLDCGDRALAIRGDALAEGSLVRVPRPVDVVFVDPPYQLMQEEASRQRVMKQIDRLRPLMGEKGFVVLRSPVNPEREDLSLEHFAGPEVHQYGKGMWVLLYEPRS